MGWAQGTSKRKSIPSISSKEETLEINDYSLGQNSFVSDDKFPVKNNGSNMWREAKNGRITTFGEYKTRKGKSFHSAGAGETKDDNQESTTGEADQDFDSTNWVAQEFTTSSAGRLTLLNLRLKNDQSATGDVIVELWSEDSDEPDTMLARSSISATDITDSYAYVSTYFKDAPELATTTDYFVVIYSNGENSYSIATTSSGSSALTSSNSGGAWSSTSVDVNFQQYYSTAGAVKGLYRARKSDGTIKTLFAHGTVLYSVDDNDGSLTSIKTGLTAGATDYRFETVNDTVYYVNGQDGLRKWDFTTESQVSSTNYSLIKEHKGLMFLAETADPNKVVFSNFADYEIYTSTDFVYVPSPKTGDPVTALVSLNGYLLIFTRKNKFILSGDDNDTFFLEEAPDQNGTFRQETVTQDDNFVYYLSEDGVYQSNGSEAELLSENMYEELRTLSNKDDCSLVEHKGRIYMFFPESGQAANNRAYVWNPKFSGQSDTMESLDTKVYISRAYSSAFDDELYVASSLVGQVFTYESEANDYTDVGGEIEFTLSTHYFSFVSPAVLKQIRYWNPRFGSTDGDYTIQAQFATDQRDNWQTQSNVSTQGSGTEWGSGATWGNFTWGSSAEVQSQLYVPGEYRRIALRYTHTGARQPHTFLGHTLVVQSRRIR